MIRLLYGTADAHSFKFIKVNDATEASITADHVGVDQNDAQVACRQIDLAFNTTDVGVDAAAADGNNNDGKSGGGGGGEAVAAGGAPQPRTTKMWQEWISDYLELFCGGLSEDFQHFVNVVFLSCASTEQSADWCASVETHAHVLRSWDIHTKLSVVASEDNAPSESIEQLVADISKDHGEFPILYPTDDALFFAACKELAKETLTRDPFFDFRIKLGVGEAMVVDMSVKVGEWEPPSDATMRTVHQRFLKALKRPAAQTASEEAKMAEVLEQMRLRRHVQAGTGSMFTRATVPTIRFMQSGRNMLVELFVRGDEQAVSCMEYHSEGCGRYHTLVLNYQFFFMDCAEAIRAGQASLRRLQRQAAALAKLAAALTWPQGLRSQQRRSLLRRIGERAKRLAELRPHGRAGWGSVISVELLRFMDQGKCIADISSELD